MKNIISLIFIFVVLQNITFTLGHDTNDYNITYTIPSGTVVYVVNINEIVGLLFSIVVLLLISIAVCIWYCWMKSRRQRMQNSNFHSQQGFL